MHGGYDTLVYALPEDQIRIEKIILSTITDMKNYSRYETAAYSTMLCNYPLKRTQSARRFYGK